MADQDLQDNLQDMAGSGYLNEDLRIDVGTFSLAGLTDEVDDDDSSEDEGTEGD